MSELKIAEKLADSFVDVFKKTKLFEKIDKIHFYIGSFVLFTSIISITGFAIHYSNTTKINENIQILNNNKREIIDKINNLEDKIIKKIESQEIKVKSSLSMDNNQININDQKKNINDTDNDDELINDCYDYIPLNNIKKVTGIKKWLY